MNRLPLVVTSKLRRCLPALRLTTDTRSISRITSVLNQTSKFAWTQKLNFSSEAVLDHERVKLTLNVTTKKEPLPATVFHQHFQGYREWNDEILVSLNVKPFKKKSAFGEYITTVFKKRHHSIVAYRSDPDISSGICANSLMEVRKYIRPRKNANREACEIEAALIPERSTGGPQSAYGTELFIDSFDYKWMRDRKLDAFLTAIDGDLPRALQTTETTNVLKIELLWVPEYERNDEKDIKAELIKAALEQAVALDCKWIVAVSTSKVQYRTFVDELGFRVMGDYPYELFRFGGWRVFYKHPDGSTSAHLVALPVETKRRT